MRLATVLGLRPLDRVQINSVRTLAEFRIDQRNLAAASLPFWFYQRELPDGSLLVRSPGGYCSTVDPTEVCDVLPQDPVRVRAIPRKTFLARLGLPLSQRGLPSPDTYYQPASVMYVMRDRWMRIDQVFVLFDEGALNESDSYAAPVHRDDREALEPLAKRTRMPVMSRSSSSYSADKGCVEAQQNARYAVGQFIAAALAGNTAKRDTLLTSGAKPLTTGQINRL